MTDIQEIPMKAIHFDQEFNCRGEIIPMDVIDLAQDIERQGLLQPVIVSEYSGEDQQRTGYKYLLVAGYRRFVAHRVLKQTKILATVKGELSEMERRVINLSENFQRCDLNVLQEAKAIAKLMELGLTEEQTAREIGKSRGWVQIRFLVLKLPQEIQNECAAGILNQKQIRDVYTHFRVEGKDAAFNAVKEIKQAKARGEKNVRAKVKKKEKPNTKHHRKRPEIFDMMEHIQVNIGNGLHTRCMAWCAGEITNMELFVSIKDYSDQHGDGSYVIYESI